MTLVDQGPSAGNILTVRGLNADSISAPESTTGNSGGDNVGTYIGEVPIYIDLNLHDMDRVEVLIGPQGTLYGAGTLGGAVRYIPNKPQADALSIELRGDVYDLNKSDDLGYETGGTINIPIIEDRLAVRASLDYQDDPGFIDYNYLVREAGVSNPQPNFNDPDDVRANLKKRSRCEHRRNNFRAHCSLRYTGDRLDGTLSYYYQDTEIGGRQVNHQDSFGTGDYVSAHRFKEPNDRKNELIALELVCDLGFAEVTSATGYSEYTRNGSRDQTDLLLDLFRLRVFPQFSASTREDQEEDRFTQELRLVSTGDGPLNWIVGGFYNKFQIDQCPQEFTPGFDQFAVDNLGGISCDRTHWSTTRSTTTSLQKRRLSVNSATRLPTPGRSLSARGGSSLKKISNRFRTTAVRHCLRGRPTRLNFTTT